MSRKQDKVKRSIKIDGLGIELDLSKVTAVKTKMNMMHLDQLADGTWWLIYNGNMIPDFSQVNGFTIVREE